MTEWINPDVIEDLKFACIRFLNSEMSVAEIQSEILNAENKIVSTDEAWLRNILLNAENEIELLTFTIDEGKLKSAVVPIVNNIMVKLS